MNRRNFLSSLLAVPVAVAVITTPTRVKTEVIGELPEDEARGAQDYWGNETEYWGQKDLHHLDTYSYTFPHRGWSED